MAVPTAPCPLCGRSSAFAFEAPVDGMTFRPTAFGRIHRCAACDFAFVAPRPDADDTRAFYDLPQYYTQGASQLARGQPYGFASRLRVHLAWRLDRGEPMAEVVRSTLPQAGARLCDVGCGNGWLARALAQRGYAMTGVERDAKAVSFADASFRVVEGSAESLPPDVSTRSFDGVLLSHVLEHLVDPVAALRGLQVLARPGARLICEVPNMRCDAARLRGLSWAHLDVPRHLNFFTEQSLRAAMTAAGLEVERIYYDRYLRQFTNEYIATEQQIHDGIAAAAPGCVSAPQRHSQAKAWRQLLGTAFAAPQRKYDSVGVVARFAAS